MLTLGQNAEIALAPDHAPEHPVHFTVPLHVAQRNGIATGVAAAVSLLAEGVHLNEPADT
jgi:molybdate transport system ATP-binding protein